MKSERTATGTDNGKQIRSKVATSLRSAIRDIWDSEKLWDCKTEKEVERRLMQAGDPIFGSDATAADSRACVELWRSLQSRGSTAAQATEAVDAVTPPANDETKDTIDDNRFVEIEGYVGELLYLRSKLSAVRYRWTANDLTYCTLLLAAPLRFWIRLYPSRTIDRFDLLAAVDAIIQTCYMRGRVLPDQSGVKQK